MKLLGNLDSIRVSEQRGSQVSGEAKALFRKFAEQVEMIFKNLPKPMEWRTFHRHDLPLLTDIYPEVQKASVKHGLNKWFVKRFSE